MAAERETLDRLMDRASAAGELPAAAAALVLDVAAACMTIGRRLSEGAQRTADDRMRTVAAFVPSSAPFTSRMSVRREWTARSVSAPRESRETTSFGLHRGRHLALLLPVDDPANLGLNAGVGTIFSILKTGEPRPHDGANARSTPLSAGYALHGPSLVLVVALAAGVHAFAYDRRKEEFVLTHSGMHIAPATDEIAVDASVLRTTEPALRRYLDECLAGEAGPRGRGFRVRWCGSMAAEVHRLLMLGGVLVHPGPGRMAAGHRALRLLEEVMPLSFVVECAGGRVSTTARVADAAHEDVRLRMPLLFGAADEVERIETYQRDLESGLRDAPLFGARGLFRPVV